MSLQVWLPLIGDMHNQGMSGVTVTSASATVDASGKIGSCMKIVDAVGLNCAPDFGTGSISFCGWFKFNKEEIAAKVSTLTINATYKQPTGSLIGNQSYGGIGITWNANNVYADGAFNSMSIIGTIRTATISARNTGSFAITFDTWIHIALTWNVETKTLSLYKNGVHHASTTTPDFSDAVIRALNVNYSGVWSGNGPGTTIPFRANDIRVYDHCLSAKEVKEISKGLVTHYKFDDQAAEMTVNAATMATNGQSGWNALTYRKEPNDTYYLTHKAAYNAYWTSFHFDIGPAYIGKTVTVSATISDFETYKVSSASRISCAQKKDSGQYPTFIENDAGAWKKTYAQLKNGDEITWTGTILSAHTIVFELYDEGVDSGFTKLRLNNVQIEEKDHKTAYACGSRGQRYDNTIYTEPDGSLWVRIAHHNNPTNALFSSTENWSYGVYKDADRWLDVYPIMYRLSRYEFMVKQTLTSGATETKYRWVQNKSPLTAAYEDVAPAAVTRVTAGGYTDGGYGGLYILNSNTHFVIANASKGNWYGAFGCWTTHQGGIPGYPNTVVKTGYMDLYVRISEADILKVYDSSGNNNNGTLTGTTTTIENSSPRYDYCIHLKSNGDIITIPLPKLTTFTYAFWFKRDRVSQSNREMLMTGWYGVSFELNSNNTLTFKCACTTSHTQKNVTSTYTFSSTTEWYHVAFAHTDGVGSKIYVNGTLNKTFSFTELLDYTSATATIGNYTNSYQFLGRYSDFRIYATELSEGEIKELYNVGASVDNNGNMFCYGIEEV